MATTETAAAAADSTAATADKKKVTTLEGMTSYRSFDSTDDAAAYLSKCAEDFSDFDKQAFAMIGVTDDGFDPAIYGEGMRVRVSVVRNVPRTVTVGGKATRDPTTIKAIVVAPVPSLDSLMTDPAGKDWVSKIIDKELNHVLVRPIRDAENIEAATVDMPRTRDAYITSSRESGGVMDTFNALFKTINDALKQVPVWDRAKLNKSDLKKGMESTAYATRFYPLLEDRGEKDSLFVTAIKLGQKLAGRDGLDATIFNKWLETRDQQTLDAQPENADDADLDLDSLVESLAAPSTEESDKTDAKNSEPAATA